MFRLRGGGGADGLLRSIVDVRLQSQKNGEPDVIGTGNHEIGPVGGSPTILEST